MKKTNWIKIRKDWETAKTIGIVAVSLWILETVYFLLSYGWHLTAINEDEKRLDSIVSVLFMMCLAFSVKVLVRIIEFILPRINES